ncbi:basic proline-rich protein-like isoform X1 [Bos javanicus]|uniref:basic proline-rich protein-like isoform X1 n=1 Tax=Bos javanicus TaxID=9906 RepID=UPI002AA77D0A|nr:basic proline-rich protein-like isoform X1 [Bos javanicus]
MRLPEPAPARTASKKEWGPSRALAAPRRVAGAGARSRAGAHRVTVCPPPNSAPGRAAPLNLAAAAGTGWGEYSPTPYFCLLVGIQRAMAATSPRGGGCGGYSSQGSDRQRAAHRRAPGPSAMFRETSLGPARRLPAAPPAIHSGSHREPRSPAAPGGHAAVRAPPGAASAPPAGRALCPPRPPPRHNPRAPASQGLRALPGPGRLRLAHFPGAVSQHRLGAFADTTRAGSRTPRQM